MTAAAINPPSLQIYQEFSPAATGTTSPLYACVLGAHYNLEEGHSLGKYDPSTGLEITDRSWAGTYDSEQVDLNSVRVHIKDALLRFGSRTLTSSVGTISGNRLTFTDVALQAGNGYACDLDIPLTIGQYIVVTKEGTTTPVIRRITGFAAKAVSAVIGALSASSANPASSEASAVITEHFGSNATSSSDIVITAAATGYKPYVSGYTTETYTCTVIETTGTIASTKVKITSASGTDDVASLTLASGDNNCGTRGLKFNITATLDNSIALGDNWVIAVQAAVTPALPTSNVGGTYAGAASGIYFIKIVRGGIVGTDDIQYKVTTDTGFDSSPVMTISEAGVFSVGNYGVAFSVTDAQEYITGQVYKIAVTAAGLGKYHTVILNESLTYNAASTYAVDFAMQQSIIISAQDWSIQTVDLFTINAAITYETYVNGVLKSLAVLSGDLYASYRILDTTLAHTAFVVNSIEELKIAVGVIDSAQNPIGIHAAAALTEALRNNVGIYIQTVTSDDIAGFTTACEQLIEVADVYSIVPATMDSNLIAPVHNHVKAMSAADIANFRRMVIGVDGGDGVVRTTGMATVSAGVLTCSSASFDTDGVASGDKLFINYTHDNVGSETYSIYTVAETVSQTTLRITGNIPDNAEAVRFTVFHKYTNAEYITATGTKASAYKDRRVTAVYADNAVLGNIAVPSSVVAASVAGARSANAPHAPLSGYILTSVSLYPSRNITPVMMNQLAGYGVQIVAKASDGSVYIRHQLTTDVTDIYTREESKTTNFDHVVRDYKNTLKAYVKGNVSKSLLSVIALKIQSVTNSIVNRTYDTSLGPQLVTAEIVKLSQDTTNKNTVWLEMNFETPDPLNNFVAKFKLI